MSYKILKEHAITSSSPNNLMSEIYQCVQDGALHLIDGYGSFSNSERILYLIKIELPYASAEDKEITDVSTNLHIDMSYYKPDETHKTYHFCLNSRICRAYTTLEDMPDYIRSDIFEISNCRQPMRGPGMDGTFLVGFQHFAVEVVKDIVKHSENAFSQAKCNVKTQKLLLRRLKVGVKHAKAYEAAFSRVCIPLRLEELFNL